MIVAIGVYKPRFRGDVAHSAGIGCGAAVIQCAAKKVGAIPLSRVVINDAVVECAAIRPAATAVRVGDRVAGERAVVERAAIRPATEGSRVAGQSAVGERAAIRPATVVGRIPRDSAVSRLSTGEVYTSPRVIRCVAVDQTVLQGPSRKAPNSTPRPHGVILADNTISNYSTSCVDSSSIRLTS